MQQCLKIDFVLLDFNSESQGCTMTLKFYLALIVFEVYCFQPTVNRGYN